MKLVYEMYEDDDIKTDDIEIATAEVCGTLPTPLIQQQCATFIDREHKNLFEWVNTVNSSEPFCTLMTACEYPIPPINSACDACMVGFEFLDGLFYLHPPQNLIDAGLKYMCHVFPAGNLRAECQEMVDQRFDELVEWVDQYFPRNFICTAAGACDFPADPIEDGLCIFCEGAVAFVANVLNFDGKHGDDFIFTILDYVCEVFPSGPSKQLCLEFVEPRYRILSDLIEHEFPAENVCVLAGVCETNITPQYENECEFCNIFYQFALELLDFDVTIESVERLLRYICEVFPPVLEATCNKFVAKFYKQLLELLYFKTDAEEACYTMGPCID